MVYLVSIQLQSPVGSVLIQPKAFYGEEDIAKGNAEKLSVELDAVIRMGKILMPGQNGAPRVLCSVEQLMGRLGVAGLTHIVTHGEMQGVVEVPKNRIIMQ